MNDYSLVALDKEQVRKPSLNYFLIVYLILTMMHFLM